MSARFFYDGDSLGSDDSSDSNFVREILYSSSSFDTSSIGSIPWAEDAIKQNQQDWERLEKMFYGEEELPDDGVLRREIIEWQTRFPHLRVVGQKIRSAPANNWDREEYRFISSPQVKFQSAKSFGPIVRKSSTNAAQLTDVLKNDLRISSVPISVRFNPAQSANNSRFNHQRSIPPQGFGKTSNTSQLYPPRKSESLLLTSPIKLTNIEALKSSNSASFVRMPPISNLIAPKSTTFHFEPMQIILDNSSRSATKQRYWRHHANLHDNQINKNAIILPALDQTHNSLPIVDSHSFSRSTSAAFKHRSQLSASASSSHVPLSASKMKLPK